MSDFVIVTDSSCDLPLEVATEYGLDVYPLIFRIANVDYKNYLDEREMSVKEFYQRLKRGEVSTTALVSTGDFLQGCEAHLEAGKDILAIMFSSGLSGTYNSMRVAADQLSQKYPERKIIVIDTLSASLGEGLLVYKAAKLKKEGKSIDEIAQWVEEHKLNMCHWITVEDLNTLKRGGRISASAALIANALQIKPVIHVDDTGHLATVEKVLGRRTSMMAIVNQMKKSYDPTISPEIFISHGDDMFWVNILSTLIKQHVKADVTLVNTCGPVIGSHSGPGTIALCFFGNKR